MKQILHFCFFVLFSGTLLAQKTNHQNFEKLLKTNQKIESYFLNKERQTPSTIKLKSNSDLTTNKLPEFIKNALQINNDAFQLYLSDKTKSKNGSEIITYSATYKGIEIAHAKYKAYVKNDKVKFISLEHYFIDRSMNKAASISKNQARELAKNFVGADKYVWEAINEQMAKTTDANLLNKLQASYDESFPKGELVYVDDYTTPESDLKLAYKFNIYALEPVSRGNIFIDAQNGKTILADAIIKHAREVNEKRDEARNALANIPYRSEISSSASVTASGDTRFAGNRNFQATETTIERVLLGDITAYSLDGTIDLSPYGIVDDPLTADVDESLVLNETRSYRGVGGLPININGLPTYSIYDGYSDPLELQLSSEVGDNNWTAEEHYRNDFSTPYPLHNEKNNDDIALDAHWGAEIVLRYWADVHGRSSHDNKGTKIINYVHYGDAYDNAFWNGTAMTYGDGSYQGGTNLSGGSFLPLTSLDVCGHEIGHGICSATSDLVYAGESGAMNEGFSDIWAAAVENYVLTKIDNTLPYDPWGVGEQIDESDGGIAPGEAGSAALRWMDDPNAAGSPSFYGGEDWTATDGCVATLVNDQCGVHTNSGVLNKWFYLLVTGSGQPLSPGANKIAADPAIQDRGAGLPYSVSGLGFDLAEQITFKAEVLLTPNALFSEMRNATILIAETEYTAYEVEQVMNAWYAVGVGEQYVAPDPNILLYESTTSMVNEKTATTGCNEFNTITVSITAASVTTAQTATFTFDDSTATLGEDFDVSPSSLTFDVSATPVTKEVTITVYNDGIIEGNETIQMNFLNGPNPEDVRKQTITILDDDYVPSIGAGTIELLSESFDDSDAPTGWIVDSAFDVNKWYFNGTAFVGPSFIETPTPIYNGTAISSVDLISKVVDARGISNVTVSFDWTAGGENDGSTILDWGEFMYTLDGSTYESVQKFSTEGLPLIGVGIPDSGTFNLAIPALDNKSFTLIWRWYNDDLIQSLYSFSVDNVLVSGNAAPVESDIADSDNETVNTGNQVYFISNQDGEVLGLIENATEDLGCVTLSILENGSSSNFSNIAGSHSGKVFKIEADGENAATATYDITLYFTDAELSDFSDPSSLQIIRVDGSSIDDATDSTVNYNISGSLLETNASQSYHSFKGTFTGFNSFALYQPSTLSKDNFETSEFMIFPNFVKSGDDINIQNSKTSINKIRIYSVLGALVKEQTVDGDLSTKVLTDSLTTGMYYLVINNNKNHSYKIIVY
ncbi:M4 family metallopeptidase [Polaribacter sp. MSW13]|uniref:M4 family metallopeptidase n=1 Tax=Polaribacter marinus TaxID=2916838 RepID=A0A9X1VQQ5_9FLAO|nr:M4 family metallopeptidase [Polaribacter marinus]MCI2230108.1 M4 family metallopeptidase [Polaribacter marinus]